MKRFSLISIATICFTTSIFLLSSMELSAQGNGQYLQFNLNVDGLTREYTLYVPEGHDGTEEWPVVFLFHGFTDPINTQIKISQMYPVADTAKFLIVYPQGLLVYAKDIQRTGGGWNVPSYYVAEHNDVVFVSRIIDDLNSDPDYAIDLNRIYATGYSNGGEFSFYLGWALNHRFASVSGISAQMNDHLINNIYIPSRQISVLHMQGTIDGFYPVNGNEFALPLKGVAEYWAGINNCNANPDSTNIEDIDQSDNSTVTLFNYSNCQNDNEVLLYRVNGGGHNWPGGWLPVGWEATMGPINKDIHASIEIWNFFKKFENPLVNKAFGQKIEISPYYIDEKEDTLIIDATLSNPDNHAVNVYTIIQGNQSQFMDTLQLFDDGLHRDGDSLDNVWGNTKLVTGLPEDEFTVDLYTCDSTYGDTLRFPSPARFFTLGPVEYTGHSIPTDFFCNETTPIPGGCLNLKLTLMNNSSVATAKNIKAKLYSLDTLISFTTNSSIFEDIPAGQSIESSNKYLLSISEEWIPDTSIAFIVKISSHDIVCWQDTMYIRVPTDVENILSPIIRIYPNPTHDLLTIETIQSGQHFIEITSLNGQLLYSDRMEGPTHQIDLSSFQKGLYFITVRSRDYVRTEKIIKK